MSELEEENIEIIGKIITQWLSSGANYKYTFSEIKYGNLYVFDKIDYTIHNYFDETKSKLFRFYVFGLLLDDAEALFFRNFKDRNTYYCYEKNINDVKSTFFMLCLKC